MICVCKHSWPLLIHTLDLSKGHGDGNDLFQHLEVMKVTMDLLQHLVVMEGAMDLLQHLGVKDLLQHMVVMDLLEHLGVRDFSSSSWWSWKWS